MPTNPPASKAPGPKIPVVEAPATVIAPKTESAPAQVGDVNIAPTTTAQDDLRTAGQRKINITWEYTQATIAIVVTVAVLGVAGWKVLKDPKDTEAFLLLSNVFFMVITTYFTRTNHTRVGGVQKDDTGR